jgi:phosphoribosylanthranilate isomerase
MTKIKMCGMMRPKDVINACELGVDYIGFILSEGFRRTVVLGTFCELESYAHGYDVQKVGVFVNEPIDNICGYYAEMLDLIQLHGNEDDRYIAELRRRTGKPVIKAFKIHSAEDVIAAEKSNADYILLDSGTGTGKTFDHSLIVGVKRPYFLAGGLTAENVGKAIEKLAPYAVDASSCLEKNGEKDYNRMCDFANAVRKV